VIETRTPILYHDWTLQPGAKVTVPVPADFNLFAFVFEGEATVSGRATTEGQMAVLGAGESVELAASKPARLLLIGGKPLREPVARYGPFVMNTREEIIQAVEDFQAGRLGAIKR
jgi:redox-sensitive bicupin YhaK (pirin superfamily)